MSQPDDGVAKCKVVVDDVQNTQNNSTNTLKSVKKKIRDFTTRKKASENQQKSDSNEEQSDMNQEDTLGKSKITLKKIFRKSSFKKIISNIQHFTNFTVSRLLDYSQHTRSASFPPVFNGVPPPTSSLLYSLKYSIHS